MDDPFVQVGIGLGIITASIYLICYRSKLTAADVFYSATIVFACVSALAGVKVCYYAVAYDNVSPMKDISTTSFFGGVAVCLTALYTIYHRFKYRQ